MEPEKLEVPEKIRQQYETAPFPRVPLNYSPKGDYSFIYSQNLVTPYYLRNQRVINTQGKIILDAGCGSGYKSLGLAEANPGAKIIGIDISEESIKLAQQRLEYHGFNNAEFYAIAIEDLPSLGIQFDYINTDEVLYLLPDPIVGLRTMQSVLKPEGIIRANLHSSRQRTYYYRAQQVFKMMGLMEENPQQMEIELVRETMKALKEQVMLKTFTWKPIFETDDQRVLMNYLLQGDKGYTIREMFAILKAADLELIDMVQWRQWQLIDLFNEPDNLPVFWGMSLAEMPKEEQLHIFELLQPIHRLLDFWCGHPNQGKSWVPIAEWQLSDWLEAQVYLHPQLKIPALQQELTRCMAQLEPLEISQYMPICEGPVFIDSSIAACLLSLWEGSESMRSLLARWQKFRPVHPVTLEPADETQALDLLKQQFTKLENLGYLLLERLP